MNRSRKFVLFLVCFTAFEWSSIGQSSMITTYAGGGGRVWPVSGAQAITEPVGYPVSVVPDVSGGFYIASSDQHRIYYVASDGAITVIAGTGSPGFSGDDGPATSAQLKAPTDLALDGDGNLYIADSGNHRIRLVSADGAITTVAGVGSQGFSGDNGSATAAQLRFPTGVAIDVVGNLYIADTGNYRVRKVGPDGVISTVAGNGTQGFGNDGGSATAAQLNVPSGVAVDASGNLFIADFGDHRIRKVNPGGVITTVAGTGIAGYSRDFAGPATSAKIDGPSDIAVDAAGNLFIAEFNLSFIRKVTPEGIISTVAGDTHWDYHGDDGPATAAGISGPSGIAVDGAGNLFIAESGNHRIRKINPTGIITTIAGFTTQGFSGDLGAALAAEIRSPWGVAADAQGNVFIADSANQRIRKVDATGVITTVAGSGSVGYELGGFSGDGGPAASAQLTRPAGVAVDAQGNLFIADAGNHRIRKVTPDGFMATIAGNGTEGFSGDGGPATSARLRFPQDVAIDSTGNLFIADSANGSIRKVTPAGVISTVAGVGRQGFSGDGGAATSAQLRYPTNITVDGLGNLFIAEFYLNRIRKVTPSGFISTVAGNGAAGFSGDGGFATNAELSGPWGVEVDAAGNMLIADSGNNRIRKVTPDGVITTVAGMGIDGFSGDLGPASSARLSWPAGVAVDPLGNLFIADWGNDRIRKVSALIGPALSLDFTQYRTGDSWSLKVGNAALDTPVRLLGTSNGQSWQISGWTRTDGSGSVTVEGKFQPGTTGSYTLQVEIGGVFSNAVTFVVSN